MESFAQMFDSIMFPRKKSGYRNSGSLRYILDRQAVKNGETENLTLLRRQISQCTVKFLPYQLTEIYGFRFIVGWSRERLCDVLTNLISRFKQAGQRDFPTFSPKVQHHIAGNPEEP